MKRIALGSILLLCLFGLHSCQKSTGPNGQLIGVDERPDWETITPHGMVYIPSGDFHSGPSDQDVNNALIQKSKAISIQGFFMDETEVTNNEYRQFVNYVRDSIALDKLDMKDEDDYGKTKLDWTYDIDWSADGDGESLQDMYYSEDEQFFGRRELDVQRLVYQYDYYDWKSAASRSGRERGRSAHLKKSKQIPVYPDTLAWIHDFSYSYNDPMTRNYFWHPAFDDYPVVGVNWYQSMAFCAWRSKLWNDFQTQNGETMGEEFRLPFEHEWEYGARGGLEHAPYPWGGPYVRNRKGCILANFKPGRGNYPEDGGFYTVKADSYHPNDFGLYNMSGNVAEWTYEDYVKNTYTFNHDMNPLIRSIEESEVDENGEAFSARKVIRGGSWKDIAYFIQTSTRDYEYADTSKSYIGFRCALTFLGRSLGDDY